MNLFIVWNSFSILELLLSEKNYSDYYLVIDKEYNKLELNQIKSICEKFVFRGVFKGLLSQDKLSLNSFNTVAIMSCLNPYHLSILDTLSFNKLICLEEGLGDYFERNIADKYLKYLKIATLYVNDLNNVKNKNYFKKVLEIHYYKEILDLFLDVLQFDKNIYDNIDLLIYTSPINKDYNYKEYLEKVINYLDENYSNKNVLIKRHPRDNNLYNSKNCNIFYADSMIPGQFFNIAYDCEKLYTHPSTVLLSAKDISKTKIIKLMDLSNEEYKKAFTYKKMKKCKIIEI